MAEDPRTAASSLAARPGQRRAVRATAVVLGLLALALGVRDAMGEPAAPPADGRPEPSSSASPSPDQDGPAEDRERADDGRRSGG